MSSDTDAAHCGVAGVLATAAVAIDPIYAVVAVVAGWVYVYAIKAMRLPLVSDEARLKSAVGRVVEVESRHRCRVEVLGEHWPADSPAAVEEGDCVKITGRDDLTLHVEKVTPVSKS